MKKYSLSFLAGNLLLHQFPSIDGVLTWVVSSSSLLVLFFLFIFAFFSPKHKQKLLQVALILLFFGSGFILTWTKVDMLLANSLPEEMVGRELIIQGHVDSIPAVRNGIAKFNFRLSQIISPKSNLFDNTVVRLSWYKKFQTAQNFPKLGEFWQLKVKLKQPSGLMNPGSFDYEKWLFQNQIRATGYIRAGKENQRISNHIKWNYYLDHFRETFSSQLQFQLRENQFQGLLQALILGNKTIMEPDVWKVYIDSGTNHLIAISGLHIGLFAAIGFFLGRYLWSFFPKLLVFVPAQQAGAAVAIIFAVSYSALAGFSIPTQRALIMLGIALLGVFLRRQLSTELVLSAALFAVLCYDPMSSLSPGFWLSFGAVAIILLFSHQYAGLKSLRHSNSQADTPFREENAYDWKPIKLKLWQYCMMPFVVYIGLLPLTVLFFERFSLFSPIANIIAVPWMSLIIVPISLLAAFVSFFSIYLGDFLFNLVEWLMQPLWWYLKIIANSESNLIYPASTSSLFVFLAIAGVIFFLQLKRGNTRFLGILLVFPLLLQKPQKIEEGNFAISVLDVGQGLSIVLQTRNYVLLYDTGNAFSEDFNMADQAIIPYLRHVGVDKLDTLILSHADNDHIGAAKYLIKAFPPKSIISGEVGRLKEKQNIKADACIAGQSWDWNGVNFLIVSPTQRNLIDAKLKSNNRSCVLLVRAENGFSALLTGDAESQVEKYLSGNQEIKNIDVLVAGHHGSKTSSSKEFIEWVNPNITVFTFGYKNRYNFPAQQVLQRLYHQNSLVYATVNGTIDISSNMPNNAALIKEYRKDKQRYWNRTYLSYNK